MTTSGISTGTMTAEEVVQAALEELGVLSAGERVTGDELLTGLRSLNWMLKSFTARGINQWRQHTTTVTFPAGQSAITLPAIIEEVTYAAVKAGANYARPLTRYQSGQYPQVASHSRGAPVSYYIDRQRDACRMTLWPAPIADTNVVIDVLRVIDDVTAGDQTVDVPQKWLETVYIALAARLATVMGVTRTDPATAATLAQRAQAFEQLLLDDDRPASIFMGDFDGSFGVGGGVYAPLPVSAAFAPDPSEDQWDNVEW